MSKSYQITGRYFSGSHWRKNAHILGFHRYSWHTATVIGAVYVDALIIYYNRYRFSESNAPEYHLLRDIIHIAVGISVSNGTHKSSTPTEMGEYDYLAGEALSYWSSSPD
jgi:hypothetical protein